MKKQAPMNKRLSELAEYVYFKYPRLNSKRELRDLCDLASGGELDCTQLDILCDMVIQRVNNPRPGEFFEVEHSRKGKFIIQLESCDDEWIRGKIISGVARHLVNPDKEAGEEITVRRSLCFFYPINPKAMKAGAA